MEVSDIILGLLIMLVLGWIVMLAVQQQGISIGLQALEAKQVAQGIQVSPDSCGQVQGMALVMATNIVEKDYFTTVGFDPDRNQIYFCFYQ